VTRVDAHQLFDLRWRTQLIQASQQGGDGAAITAVLWKEVEDALEAPQLVRRGDVLVPNQLPGERDHD